MILRLLHQDVCHQSKDPLKNKLDNFEPEASC
jgi:hypothetical protein